MLSVYALLMQDRIVISFYLSYDKPCGKLALGQDSKSLTLYTFYRPPDSNIVDLNLLNSSLRSNSESSCVLAVGDFNIPALDWTDSSSPVNIRGNAIGDNFCDLMGENFLFQFIRGPTHIAGSKLDIVLCNCPEVINGVSTLSPGVSKFPSDHYIIDFLIRVKFH